MIPFLTSFSKGKTTNIYKLSINDYENNITISVENEQLIFNRELVEMKGYCSDITEEDETYMYYRLGLSVSTIETIKNFECVIITTKN